MGFFKPISSLGPILVAVAIGGALPAWAACPIFEDRVVERAAGEHKGREQLSAVGDFDGDGYADQVFFLEGAGKFFLVVCLHGRERAIEVMELSSIGNHGVRLARRGAYTNACAKGYGRGCGPDDVVNLKLDHAAIEFFKYESSSQLVYWDGDRFDVFPLSD